MQHQTTAFGARFGAQGRGATNRLVSTSQSRGDVAHLLDETVRIPWYCDEPVVRVEAGGGFIQGIHDDQPSGGNIAGRDHSGQGVPEQFATELLSMKAPMQRKASQQNRGDRTGRTVPDPLGYVQSCHQVSGKAEVCPYHALPCVPDERLSRAHRLGLGGAPTKPIVERRFSRIEIVQLVLGPETLRDPPPPAWRRHYR